MYSIRIRPTRSLLTSGIRIATPRNQPRSVRPVWRKGPTAVTRGMTPAGGTYASTTRLVFLDHEVLHRPIGQGLLTGGLEENGGCPRNRLRRRVPLETLGYETAFWHCGHWGQVQLATTA